MQIRRIDLAGPLCIPEVCEIASPVTPLFSAEDGAAEAIARFEGTDIPAIVRKKKAESTAWFCSLPPASPALLRRIFQESGAHIYDTTGDVIIAGWDLLCLHTLGGGPRSLCLHSGKRVEVVLPPRSTTLVDAETGAVVIGSIAPAHDSLMAATP